MNNVTISDLSEKSTLEDTDLFLVRDSNDADMKIKGKVFADKITDSLSGYTKDNDTLSTLNTASKKPVNSSAVNSALTNYTKTIPATRNGTVFTFDLSVCSVGDVIEINCFNSNNASCYSANWIKDGANSIYLIGVLKNNNATISKSGTTLTVTLTGSVGGCCIGKASINH